MRVSNGMKLLTALTLSVAALFASPALASAAPGNQPSNKTYNAPYAAAGSERQGPAARHGKHGKHAKHGKHGKHGKRGQQAHQGQRGQHRKMIKQAMLQRFDRNGDRRLDPAERAAMKATFDTNRDGKLDRNERRALKQSVRPGPTTAPVQRNQPGRGR